MMDKPRPPLTGIQMVDNVLIAIWPILIGVNFSISASAFANIMLGLGSLAGAILTGLRIYEHLKGETVATTLEPESADAED